MKLISVVISTAASVTFVVVLFGLTVFMVGVAIVDGVLQSKIKTGGYDNGKTKRSFIWYK